MSGERIKVHSEQLGESTVRFELLGPEGPLSWRSVLAGWRADTPLIDSLGRALAELPFVAFRWETPPMTAARLDKTFECVAVDDPSLDVEPDPSPFDEHLREDRSVVCFPNLGGDALMVVPCRQNGVSAYGHIAAFLRRAPLEQQHALWQAVSEAMSERLGERPVWLSTAGAGVAWLHVRLDDRPKYYAHDPYRVESLQRGA